MQWNSKHVTETESESESHVVDVGLGDMKVRLINSSFDTKNL